MASEDRTEKSPPGVRRLPEIVLGGGGIGQVWGATTSAEVIATVHHAYASGVRFFDMAPLYGNAEEVLGQAFAAGYPQDITVSTKCMVGSIAPHSVRDRLESSLAESCTRLRRDYVDLFFLHGYIIEDGWRGGPRADVLDLIAMPWTLYSDTIVPELERLVEAGRIGAWGISTGPAGPTKAALAAAPSPSCIQAVVNALNTSGGMHITGEQGEDPGAIVPFAKTHGVEVMAIRALAAGALTDGFDRDVPVDSPERRDFDRATGFRALAHSWGQTPAALAYRYALSVKGVDRLVLGAKNRQELDDFLQVYELPALTDGEMEAIRASVA